MKNNRVCKNCSLILTERHQIKFCSNKCQMNYQYVKYIDSWKMGKTDGNIGINVKNISRYLKKYLINKYGDKCLLCGWNRKHPVTGVIPLEIDHIDGNAENNNENNLRLICPNCHALTPFFKNLNKGKGRKWRMQKYVKNTASKKIIAQ